MDKWCSNRLTVLGPRPKLQRFLKSNWDRRLQARHIELLENSPGRFACTLETDEPPMAKFRALSQRFPGLTFLFDHESEFERIKGLAKAHGGQLKHFEISY